MLALYYAKHMPWYACKCQGVTNYAISELLCNNTNWSLRCGVSRYQTQVGKSVLRYG
jgi:hypothetical protein